MPNPTEFSKIRSIFVQFTENYVYRGMHASLNRLYSDDLPKYARLFKDETMTELLEEDELVPLIRQIIIKDMILPFTSHADDDTHIKPLIMMATIHVRVPGIVIDDPVLSRDGLLMALENACTMKSPKLELLIDTGDFYRTTKVNVTYQDWSQLTSNAALSVLPDPPVLNLRYVQLSSPSASRAPTPENLWILFNRYRQWSAPTSPTPKRKRMDP